MFLRQYDSLILASTSKALTLIKTIDEDKDDDDYEVGLYNHRNVQYMGYMYMGSQHHQLKLLFDTGSTVIYYLILLIHS